MQSFLAHSGYVAVLLLAFVESCCIPLPSEITFGFAGAIAGGALGGPHSLSLLPVIAVGTLGELVGSLVAFEAGRLGGRPLVERIGRFVLLTRADLDRTEQFFRNHGNLAVPVGRAMPLIRAFVSVVAGIAEMSVLRFAAFSLLGTAAYASAVAGAGYALAGSWHQLAHGLSVAAWVLGGAIVLAVALVVVLRIGRLRRERVEVDRGA